MKVGAILREINPFYEFSVVRDVARVIKRRVSEPINYIADSLSGSYAPRSFSYGAAERYNSLRFDFETSRLHEKHAKQDEKLMKKIEILREQFNKKIERLKQKLSDEAIEKRKEKFENKIEKLHNKLTTKQMNEWGKLVDRDERRTAITIDRYM